MRLRSSASSVDNYYASFESTRHESHCCANGCKWLDEKVPHMLYLELSLNFYVIFMYRIKNKTHEICQIFKNLNFTLQIHYLYTLFHVWKTWISQHDR